MSREPSKRIGERRAEKHSAEAKGFFDAYAQLARNLRLWLLTYGVGGPVIFLTNDAAGRKLIGSGNAETVALLFLFGVGLQVMATLLYKWAVWFLYSGEIDEKFRSTAVYRWSARITDFAAVEIAIDIVTIACLLGATWIVVKVTLAAT